MAVSADQIQNLTKFTTFYGIGLVVALIILAFMVHRIRYWYRGSDDPTDERNEIIRQLKESASRGDLSDEEFRSIKSRISSNDERQHKTALRHPSGK